MTLKTLLHKALVSPELAARVERLPEAGPGSFGYDAWGYHKESVKLGLALLRPLYKHYFRVEAHGLEHIPPQGRAVIVANHSGQLPFDGLLIGMALALNPHGPRAPRALVERFVPSVPYINLWLARIGAVLGDPLNGRKLLEAEQAVIVFPEGARGGGKPFKERYRLQRFGTGFMRLAVEQRAPIVPVGVVGCEEAMPSLANIKPLARLLGLPYFPLAFPVPLPVKVILGFGPALSFQGVEDTEAETEAKVEQVKEAVRALIGQGLARRKGLFW